VLLDILKNNSSESRKLRAMWALHCVNGLSTEATMDLLNGSQPYVCVGDAVLCEAASFDAAVAEFARLASDGFPVVRLYLASADAEDCGARSGGDVAGLLTHSEDAKDHNLPLMDWWAWRDLPARPGRALALASDTKLPNILSFAVRRIAGLPGDMPLGDRRPGESGRRHQAIGHPQGLRDGLRGQRKAAMPAGWKELRTQAHLQHRPLGA